MAYGERGGARRLQRLDAVAQLRLAVRRLGALALHALALLLQLRALAPVLVDVVEVALQLLLHALALLRVRVPRLGGRAQLRVRLRHLQPRPHGSDAPCASQCCVGSPQLVAKAAGVERVHGKGKE